MADALQPNDSYLADMFSIWEDTLQCAICIGPFRRPVALNCLHSFCKECIELMMKTLNTRKIACPTCRKTTYIYNKSQGADCLARNWYIEDIYDKIRKTQAYLTNRQGEPVAAIGGGVGSDRFAVCTDHCRGVAPYGTTCTQCVLELSTYLQAASKHVLIYDSTRKRYVPLVPYIATTTPSILRMTAMTRRMCNEILTPKMVMLTPLDDRWEKRCPSRTRKQRKTSPLAMQTVDGTGFTIRPSSLGTGGVELSRAEATSSPENEARHQRRDEMRRNEFQQLLSAVLAEEVTLQETNSRAPEDNRAAGRYDTPAPVGPQQPTTFQQAESVQSELNVNQCPSTPVPQFDCRPKCGWRPPHGRQISPPLRRMSHSGGTVSPFGANCLARPTVAQPRRESLTRSAATAPSAVTPRTEQTAASGATGRNGNGMPRHEFRPARTREETLEAILTLMNDATPLEVTDPVATPETPTEESHEAPQEPSQPPQEPSQPPQEPSQPPQEPSQPPQELSQPPQEPSQPPQEPPQPPRENEPAKGRSEEPTDDQSSSSSDHSVVTSERQQISARQLEPDSVSSDVDDAEDEGGASGDSDVTAAARDRPREKHQTWVWRLFGLGDKSSK